jgi:hypothetical protein
MRNIKTETIINASPEVVWEILMTHDAYPNWNPFIKEITGLTEPGEYLKVNIQPGEKEPMVFKPIVLTNEEVKEFRWRGKFLIKGIVDGEHYFLLEEINQNQTRFIQGENFTGILSGIFYKMMGKDTAEGFDAMNEALKEQAENTNS